MFIISHEDLRDQVRMDYMTLQAGSARYIYIVAIYFLKFSAWDMTKLSH